MRPSVIAAVLVTGVALAATTSLVSAQPGVAAPIAPPSSAEGPLPPLAPLPKARPGAYRPAAAFFLSLGASVALTAAVSNGVFDDNMELAGALWVVAPSAGRWYVGQIGVLGMAMRLGGVLCIREMQEPDQDPELFVTGLTLTLGGVLYDAIGSGITAHRQNQRRWAASPTVVRAPRGSTAIGLGLAGSF
jgi:hypothetical protein